MEGDWDGAGGPTLCPAPGQLARLLDELLLPLPPGVRQRLEADLESVGRPLALLEVLVDPASDAPLEARQLAGVLLARQLPKLWPGLVPADREKLQTTLLRTLGCLDCGTQSSHFGSAGGSQKDILLRVITSIASQVARCIASESGTVFEDLFQWMQVVGSERDGDGKCAQCGTVGGIGLASKRKALLYLLTNVVELPPWQQLLEPHLAEILDLLCHIILTAHLHPIEHCAHHAVALLGTISLTLVHGEVAAQLFFRGPVTKVLLSNVVLCEDELCEVGLEALAKAAGADELLVAEENVYFPPPPSLPPSELCGVVRVALGAAAAHRGTRRLLALQLLHSIADSHARLLVTSGPGGKLSASQAIGVLVESVAVDEATSRGEAAFPLGSGPAEWGAEYAALACISRRLPNRLVLPVLYQAALRSFTASDSLLLRAVCLAAMRAVLLGCVSMVKRQLQRLARLVLRGLAEPVLHVVAFSFSADLCSLVSADARCGSARLTERLLPPLLTQLRRLPARHEAFADAITALEAACPLCAKGARFRPPQVGMEAAACLCDKLRELIDPPSGGHREQEEAMAVRLCSLLGALVRRLPSDLATESVVVKVLVTLRMALACMRNASSRSIALLASGSWLRFVVEAGLGSFSPCDDGAASSLVRSGPFSQPAPPGTPPGGCPQDELLHLCLQVSEQGLAKLPPPPAGHAEPLPVLPVEPEASIRFFASLGAAGWARLLPGGPPAAEVLAVGLERCAERPSPGLLEALVELVPVAGIDPGLASRGLGPPSLEDRLAPLFCAFLADPTLRRPAAELAKGCLPLYPGTIRPSVAPLLCKLADLLHSETRPEVLTSLCGAASHFVVQALASELSASTVALGPVLEAVGRLRLAAESLPRHAMACCTAVERPENPNDEESSSEDPSTPSSAGRSSSSESAMTVASTADIEVPAAADNLQRAVRALRGTLGIE